MNHDSSPPTNASADSVTSLSTSDQLRGVKALKGFVVLATVVAAGVLLHGWLINDATHRQWIWFCSLAVVAALHTELSRGVERQRRRLNDTSHINLTSVWTFAGALLLTPALAVTLVCFLYGHLWLRVWHSLRNRPAHRVIFSLDSMVLAVSAACWAVSAMNGTDQQNTTPTGAALLVVLLAGVAFSTVDLALPAMFNVLRTGQFRPRTLIGSAEDNALEIATLCLGAIIAVVLPQQPLLLALLIVPLLVLHRAVLVKQLERMATTDQKTGLLNAVAWNTAAEHELARAQRTNSTFGLLMVDLDHFKRVNDTHGHLAGDEVLKAVATLLTESTRPYDLVGRFGGEEFVVLVPGVSAQAVISTAERIRQRVTELRVPVESDGEILVIDDLSTSVGVATYPEGGSTVSAVLQTADTGVYAAKNGGRNRVVSLVNTM